MLRKRRPESRLVLVGSGDYWQRRRRQQMWGHIRDALIGACISATISCIVGTIWQQGVQAERKYWSDYVSGLDPNNRSIIITPPAKPAVLNWDPRTFNQMSPF